MHKQQEDQLQASDKSPVYSIEYEIAVFKLMSKMTLNKTGFFFWQIPILSRANWVKKPGGEYFPV